MKVLPVVAVMVATASMAFVGYDASGTAFVSNKQVANAKHQRMYGIPEVPKTNFGNMFKQILEKKIPALDTMLLFRMLLKQY